jgi:uncharacterized protein
MPASLPASPYGHEITKEKLDQVASAENLLRSLGFRQCRVRHHGDVARIEVPPPDIPKVVAFREKVTAELKALGFRYVALDLQGYRAGSMNETLGQKITEQREE